MAVLGASSLQIDSATLDSQSGSAPMFAARAWVNFNGTGTIAMRANGNVSSITDGGTGNYTVVFTTAMTDAKYCATAPCTDSNVTSWPGYFGGYQFSNDTKNSSAFQFHTGYAGSSNGVQDASQVSVAFFR